MKVNSPQKKLSAVPYAAKEINRWKKDVRVKNAKEAMLDNPIYFPKIKFFAPFT